MENEELVLIHETKDPVEVALVKGALEEEGITCFVLDEHTSEILNFLPDTVMRILVPEDEAELAVELAEVVLREDYEPPEDSPE